MEHACNERTFVRNARFFFDHACKCQHAVPVAKRFPLGSFALFHLVADLKVGGDHLSQYGFFVGVDGEWVRIWQQVAFKGVPFDAE